MRAGAVYTQGHWRRRDPLDGLNAALRAALEDAFAEPLVRRPTRWGEGRWHSGLQARGHAQATVAAAARRGLLHMKCDDCGANASYALTARGLECVEDIRRRAKARASLSRGERGRGEGFALSGKAAP